MSQYQNIIYIGRFQPEHNAHLRTMLHALTLADKLIIVIGSANQPRDEDNPFTHWERHEMIHQSLVDASVDMSRVNFVFIENSIYNNTEWALNVTESVKPHLLEGKTKIIGHSKDETTFYLQMFKQWGKPIEMPMVEILDATTIRNMYFSPKMNMNFFHDVLPPAVIRFLETFRKTEHWDYVCAEAEYIRNYRAPHELMPYPPVFMTGDAVVIKSGHVLMIRRKSQPGKGLWAFPGGFMNAQTRMTKGGKLLVADNSVLDTAIRELYEETKIDLPEKLIRGCIKAEHLFDAVNRSRRGRIMTMAQLIVLPDDGQSLPKVRGSDDAERAEWRLITEVQRIETFEDHMDILQWCRGRID